MLIYNKDNKPTRKRPRTTVDSEDSAEKKNQGSSFNVFMSGSEQKRPSKSGKSGLSTRGHFKCEECGALKRNKTDLKNCLLLHNQEKTMAKKSQVPDESVLDVPRSFRNHQTKSLNLLKLAVTNRGNEIDKEIKKKLSRELFPESSKVLVSESSRLDPDAATAIDYIEAIEESSPELELVKSKIRIMAGRSAILLDNFRDLEKRRVLGALRELLELKEIGKVNEEQLKIVMISAIINALDGLLSQKKSCEAYRKKWFDAQKAQAETQKIASRMEEDMLETLRENIVAMKKSEQKIDQLTAQKSELMEKHEELTRLFDIQAENIEALLCGQTEPSYSSSPMSDDDIDITNVKFQHLEPEVKVESDVEVGTPLSVIYESSEEPDDNGKFPKSKKEKGVSTKKSRPKSKNNN